MRSSNVQARELARCRVAATRQRRELMEVFRAWREGVNQVRVCGASDSVQHAEAADHELMLV